MLVWIGGEQGHYLVAYRQGSLWYQGIEGPRVQDLVAGPTHVRFWQPLDPPPTESKPQPPWWVTTVRLRARLTGVAKEGIQWGCAANSPAINVFTWSDTPADPSELCLVGEADTCSFARDRDAFDKQMLEDLLAAFADVGLLPDFILSASIQSKIPED